ncbi:MAG: hypothetical protein HWD92_01205 [Flavobacteriia bacterium]|nr:hypothetical protein [Flavobacteriia bacterium]
MKLFKLIFILSMTFSFGEVMAQDVPRDEDGFPTFEYTEDDSTYVMRQYVFVMYIKAEGGDDFSEEELAEIQAGHMAHIGKMADEGNLVMAGPFGDKAEWRGILIFNDHDVERVSELVNQDPAVQAGRLTFEAHPWWAARGSRLP